MLGKQDFSLAILGSLCYNTGRMRWKKIIYFIGRMFFNWLILLFIVFLVISIPLIITLSGLNRYTLLAVVLAWATLVGAAVLTFLSEL